MKKINIIIFLFINFNLNNKLCYGQNLEIITFIFEFNEKKVDFGHGLDIELKFGLIYESPIKFINGIVIPNIEKTETFDVIFEHDKQTIIFDSIPIIELKPSTWRFGLSQKSRYEKKDNEYYFIYQNINGVEVKKIVIIKK
jgi:hypothetical protein